MAPKRSRRARSRRCSAARTRRSGALHMTATPMPTSPWYWQLRRRALGMETLKAHDTRAPLQDLRLQVPYEQAVEWVAAGVAPLGEEYVQILRRGALQDRWVDVYPNKGKRMGAFSTGVMDTLPFIFMSYSDDIFAM